MERIFRRSPTSPDSKVLCSILLCFFSDASTIAIAAVAYLRTFNEEGQCYVGFIMGKSKHHHSRGP